MAISGLEVPRQPWRHIPKMKWVISVGATMHKEHTFTETMTIKSITIVV